MNFDISEPRLIFHSFQPTWVRVTGEDAASFLQGQFTNDLREAANRGGTYGLWLDQKGKVLADSFIKQGRNKNEFWLMSYFSSAAALTGRLEPYVIADDVVFEDLSAHWAAMTILGSDAENWCGKNASQGFVFPGRRSGGKNLEWIFPAGQLAAAREQLIASGVVEYSAAEIDRLRIEAGIPAVPRDIGATELPNEGGLEVDAISYTKGCYLGQEVMARLKSMGRVRRRLLRVAGSGGVPARLPAPLFLGERRMGELRSAAPKTAGEFAGLALLSLINLPPGAKLAFVPSGHPAVTLLDQP